MPKPFDIVFRRDFGRVAACFAAAAIVAALAVMVALSPRAAAAPGSSSKPVRLPHVARRLAERAPLRIVAFGSSSTEGAGASSPAASYPSRLQVDLAASLSAGETVAVTNRGVGGEDVDDMMRRLPAIVALHPDLVIWQTGSNDPLRNVPPERFVAETQAGIAAMRDAGIDVVLMEPQYCPLLQRTAGSARFRDAVRAIGERMGVPVVRRFDLMQEWLTKNSLTSAQLLAPDGLHMADAGYARLAEAVAREILAEAGAALPIPATPLASNAGVPLP